MTQRRLRASWWALCLQACLCAACQGEGESFRGHKPAKITHAHEGHLSQIELTDAAVKRLAIKTVAVQTRPVTRRRLVGGEIMAPPGRSATLTAPMAGTVLGPRKGSLPSPGTELSAGQTVLRFSPMITPGQNLQVDIQRDLASAETRHDIAQRFAERLEVLGKEGAGDQNAYEMAAADATVAKAELDAARQRKARLSGKNPLAADVTIPIRAPLASVLMRLLVAEGQTVVAGAPLFEVATLARPWVRVPIYVGDLAELDRSKPGRVLPLGRAPGAVGVVAHPIDAPAAGRPEIASADLYFQLDSEATDMVPGQRVRVEVPLRGDGEPRPVVPQAAVLYDLQGGAWSYVDRGDHTYERTRIEVAYVDAGLAVLSLAPPDGTLVVTDGAAELFGTEFGAHK